MDWVALKKMVFFYAPKVAGAIAVLIVGYLVIKLVMGGLRRLFAKKKMEPSLSKFLLSLINVLLQTLLWISVLGMIGIQMASFIALIGAAGFAIGMALTGTLQNFAAGVMILLLKPFKVGDVIESQGILGSVEEIGVFSTILKTPDNRVIIVPNSQLSNVVVTNYTREPLRRVDWTFGIGYGDDVAKAQAVLLQLIEQDSRILKDPAPFIAVSELADSSVNLVVRVWVKTEDYWNVFFDMNRRVYEEFGKNGINIPYPQMDVHLFQEQ